MRYFRVDPEVAGGWGESTVADRSVHPPVIERLHYEFDGWMGDALIESFPVFILTEDAKKAFIGAGITGALFGDVKVTTSEQFEELQSGDILPKFVWLKPAGIPGRDDVAIVPNGQLVLSQRAIDTLRPFGFAHADIEPFNG